MIQLAKSIMEKDQQIAAFKQEQSQLKELLEQKSKELQLSKMNYLNQTYEIKRNQSPNLQRAKNKSFTSFDNDHSIAVTAGGSDFANSCPKPCQFDLGILSSGLTDLFKKGW